MIPKLLSKPNVRGALLLAGLCLLFFARPLLGLGTTHFSSADLLQVYSLTNVRPEHVPANQLLSDPVTQMQCWLEFNRSELLAGRVPLWNSFNGCGTPHLANYQSSVFSIFSVPYYLLGAKLGLLAGALFKLYALGLLTFLFLRELGVRVLPAVLGGTVFMFAGHNSILVAYPHSGVVVMIPAALLCVERILGAVREERAAGVGAYLGVAASLAVGLLAGQPEPFYFCALLVALYCAVRVGGLILAPGGAGRGRAVWAGVGLLLAGLCAAGLGAVQWVPFFEYLAQSSALGERSHIQQPLVKINWPLYFFPDLVGNPARGFRLAFNIPPPNYQIANMAHAGSGALLLALLSLAFVRRSSARVLLALVALLWPFYAHNLFGLAHVWGLIPGMDLAPINRSQGVWLFALACCSAFAVDGLMARGAVRRSGPALVSLALGAGLLAVFHWGARDILAHVERVYDPGPEFLGRAREHMLFIVVTFALMTSAAAGLWLATGARARAVLAGTLLLGAALQTGYVFSGYNPSCEDELFFPVSDAIADLQSRAGSSNLLILGVDTLPPDANLAYGLSLTTHYDAVAVARYDRLHAELFGASGNWRDATRASERALALFGVEYVLVAFAWSAPSPLAPGEIAAFEDHPESFEYVGEHGRHRTYRYARFPARDFCVSRAILAGSEAEAWERVTAPDFDPTLEVVVEGAALTGPAGTGSEPAKPAEAAEVLEQNPQYLHLRVERDEPGYLVLTRTWFDGWRARVNGREVPLLRANYAFSAVEVGAGTSEVVLSFEPRSFRLGAWISLASLLLACLAAVLGRLARRNRRNRRDS